MPSLLSMLARVTLGFAILCACNEAEPATESDAGGPSLAPSSEEAGTPSSDSPDASMPADGWDVVSEDLDAPVLSVWGTAPDSVFFVGERGLVLQRDGDEWIRWTVPTAEALWWVWGRSERDVYAGGEGGTLLHFDGSTWRRVATPLDEQETVWGIWGVANEVWLVGGRARTNGPGFLIEGDGSNFSRVATGRLPNLYKVWGTTRRDVWIVGDDTSAFRFEDGELVEQELGPAGENSEPLFTVSGSRTPFVVGGVSQGLAFEWRSGEFREVPFATTGLNGVSVSESGRVVVAGLFGVIREREELDWQVRDLMLERHYHAVLAFDDAAYAVGGDLLASGDERRGLIVGQGTALPSSRITFEDRSGTELPDAGRLDSGSSGAGGAPPDGVIDSGLEPEPTIPHDAGFDGGGGGGSETLPDAAIDAGEISSQVDSGPSLPGPSEPCAEGYECAEGLECWYIQGEGELRCVPSCEVASDCPPEFGDDPQCAPPGCQTTLEVCLRSEWEGCFL